MTGRCAGGVIVRSLVRPVLALAGALAAAMALAGPSPVSPGPGSPSARAPAAVDAWDCWVETGPDGGIHCIADRDRPRPLPEDYTDDDEVADVLLELVHDYLHRGSVRRAGELVREERHLLRRGDLWIIRLNAPPLDSSWLEARPGKLVRSVLCRGQPGCAVRFHR